MPWIYDRQNATPATANEPHLRPSTCCVLELTPDFERSWILERNGFSPRLFDGGGAHQARPDARLREDRRSARLPHRRKRCLAEAQSQAGPQGGVTGMPRPDRAA